MSYYIKRISVLKQIGTGFSMNGKALSGLAKIEKTGLNETIVLSLINAAPVTEGYYFAVLCGTDKNYVCLNLGKNPLTYSQALPFLIDMEEGFACLVCFVHQNRALSVAFGTSGLVNSGVEVMKEALLKNNVILQNANKEPANISTQKPYQTEKKAPVIEENKPEKLVFKTDTKSQENNRVLKQDIKPPELQFDIPEISDAEDFRQSEKVYQDEIVATDNYYLYNDVDIDNLSIKGRENESENIENDNAYRSNQEVYAKETTAKKATDNESFINLFKDPSTFDFDNVSKSNYYERVKSELDNIFTEHPREDALEKNIPYSKWAKIFYTNDKYYTVGLIYDEKRPAYICYGVPGKYSKVPPEELKGFCSYLPLSIFDMKGDGYWMMYQNADSGECVQIDFI